MAFSRHFQCPKTVRVVPAVPTVRGVLAVRVMFHDRISDGSLTSFWFMHWAIKDRPIADIATITQYIIDAIRREDFFRYEPPKSLVVSALFCLR